jgi:hypothetical protein
MDHLTLIWYYLWKYIHFNKKNTAWNNNVSRSLMIVTKKRLKKGIFSFFSLIRKPNDVALLFSKLIERLKIWTNKLFMSNYLILVRSIYIYVALIYKWVISFQNNLFSYGQNWITYNRKKSKIEFRRIIFLKVI